MKTRNIIKIALLLIFIGSILFLHTNLSFAKSSLNSKITIHNHIFTCNGATSNIKLTRQSFIKIGYEEIELKVFNKHKNIKLVFYNGYFGISSQKNHAGKEYIIFQQYHEGSSSRDGDNFGIIDPQTLEVLLVPNNENYPIAKKIIGDSLKTVEVY